MSSTTKIEWTDRTWNPVRGCTRVSEGCVNCYAEKVATRFSGEGLPYEGLVTERGIWNGHIKLVPEALAAPLGWRKSQKIFVNSMSDLFHKDVPMGFIFAVLAIATVRRDHKFQILTKRPERMKHISEALNDVLSGDRRLLLASALSHYGGNFKKQIDVPFTDWPLPNVWLGVSVEDQKTADERIPILMDTPAHMRFISYEPALAPVDFSEHFEVQDPSQKGFQFFGAGKFPMIHWLIVGGESGAGARPCDLDWIRNTIKQCKDAGVPIFCKQLGSIVNYTTWHIPQPGFQQVAAGRILWQKKLPKKGGDMDYWPIDLRIREFPNIGRISKEG